MYWDSQWGTDNNEHQKTVWIKEVIINSELIQNKLRIT